MRKSTIEVNAVEKAMALLNDPKVRLIGYRTQLICALLKHEHQRRELAAAKDQRKHEKEMAKLKADQDRQQPKPDAESILAAARAQLGKGTNVNG